MQDLPIIKLTFFTKIDLKKIINRLTNKDILNENK